jgi:hypothetical protein
VYCEELDEVIDIIELLYGIPARRTELRGILFDIVHERLHHYPGRQATPRHTVLYPAAVLRGTRLAPAASLQRLA